MFVLEKGKDTILFINFFLKKLFPHNENKMSHIAVDKLDQN